MRVMIEPNTSEWLAWRRTGGFDNQYDFTVTASEMPAILGFSPFMDREELFYIKLGIKDPKPPTPVMEFGSRIEPIIRAFVNERSGDSFLPACFAFDHDPFILASVDGYSESSERLLEIKFTSGSWYNDVKDGASIPLHIQAQVVTQALVTGVTNVLVAIFGHDPFVEFDPSRLRIVSCVVTQPQMDVCREAANVFLMALIHGDLRTRNAHLDMLAHKFRSIPMAGSLVVSDLGKPSIETSLADATGLTLEALKAFARECAALTVDSDDAASSASNARRTLGNLIKALNDRKRELCFPLKEEERKIIHAHKLIITPVEEADKHLAESLSQWVMKKRNAAQAVIEAAIANPELRSIAKEMTAPGALRVEKSRVKTVVRYEIVNPDLVPRELCSPDKTKIQAVLPQAKDLPAPAFDQQTGEVSSVRKELVPGIEVWAETVVERGR